jgi:hypothetical protein
MKNLEIKSASMLVTNGGFFVKIETPTNPICFFVDKDFNHRPWKLTIKKGEVLDQREFWRLRRVHKLEEISLSRLELTRAIDIAELITIDPYVGLTKDERVRLLIPSHEIMIKRSENEEKANTCRTKNTNNLTKVESIKFASIPGFSSLMKKFA